MLYSYLQSVLRTLAASPLLIACFTGIAVELIPILFIKLTLLGDLKPIRWDILVANIARAMCSYLLAACVMMVLLPPRWRLLRGIGLAWVGAGLAGAWQAYRLPYSSASDLVYFYGAVASVCVGFCLYLGVLLSWLTRRYAEESRVPSILSNDS